MILAPQGNNTDWDAKALTHYIEDWCKTQNFHGSFRVDGNRVIGTFNKTTPDQVQAQQASLQQYIERNLKKPMGKATGAGTTTGDSG